MRRFPIVVALLLLASIAFAEAGFDGRDGKGRTDIGYYLTRSVWPSEPPVTVLYNGTYPIAGAFGDTMRVARNDRYSNDAAPDSIGANGAYVPISYFTVDYVGSVMDTLIIKCLESVSVKDGFRERRGSDGRPVKTWRVVQVYKFYDDDDLHRMIPQSCEALVMVANPGPVPKAWRVTTYHSE